MVSLSNPDTANRNTAALQLLPSLLVELCLGKDSGRYWEAAGRRRSTSSPVTPPLPPSLPSSLHSTAWKTEAWRGFQGVLAASLKRVLAEALAALSKRVLELPLGARDERHAVFARLSELHTAAKGSRQLDKFGREAGEKLMEEALKELEWLKAEAADMAVLGRNRVEPAASPYR